MRKIFRELRAKLIGLAIALLLPLARIALGIGVFPTINWRLLVLAMVVIVIVWAWAVINADTPPEEKRSDDLYVNVALIVWGLLLTFFSNLI